MQEFTPSKGEVTVRCIPLWLSFAGVPDSLYEGHSRFDTPVPVLSGVSQIERFAFAVVDSILQPLSEEFQCLLCQRLRAMVHLLCVFPKGLMNDDAASRKYFLTCSDGGLPQSKIVLAACQPNWRGPFGHPTSRPLPGSLDVGASPCDSLQRFPTEPTTHHFPNTQKSPVI